MRGFGQSSVPSEISAYGISDTVGCVRGVPVAWYAALVPATS
jgi:hypothetical protein